MQPILQHIGVTLLTGLLLLLAGLAGCHENPVDVPEDAMQEPTLPEAVSAVRGPTVPFADAEVFFEQNLTDDDLGLQIFLDADGWTRVDVSDPGNQKIVQVHTQGPLSDLGITELRFESAEPSPAEVLALFPPGEYTFTGKTVENGRLVGTGELSHVFVPAFAFTPADGALVDPNNTTVTWDAPGAELMEVIIENDDNDNLFDVITEGASGSLTIPPQFLESGIEYKLELLAYHENGNRTILERFFVTQ